MARRIFLVQLFSIILCSCQNDDKAEPVPFTPIDLHEFGANLKGFNLLGKFDVNWSNEGFVEEDFMIISDLGFNFARLPLDYLTYTKTGDWDTFLDDEIAEIDQAIQWGQKYGVHICISLHRAPGYSVNTSPIPANQQVNLWEDASAQNAFIKHWIFFANRYEDVPNTQLSFNLINEPNSSVDEVTYVTLMTNTIEEIHKINPNRVVFVDGLNYSNDIITSLRDKRNVIQALHVYEPFTLTHYQASWVEGSDTWPEPVWPMIDISNYLFGPWKPEYQSSLVLEGNFLKDSKIIINVKQVSIQSTIEIKLDDQTIYTKAFICGGEIDDDWTEIINTQWGYQNISNKDYSVVIPANGSTLSISNTAGDWMTLNAITIQSESSDLTLIPGNNAWGAKQETYSISPDGKIMDDHGYPMILRNLYQKMQRAKDQDIPIMIQEFGVHNKTPHTVSLNYLKDVVSVFREYDLGYAMWNLSGSLGIINSGRDDCAYESYQGQLLDSAMLKIIE